MKKILPFVLALFLLISAIAHMIKPELYKPMIPDFISVSLANILATFTETIIGIMLIITKYKKWGGLGFMLLMFAFLPIHAWDLFRGQPAIGVSPMPEIRILIQFALIYAGWWIYKKHK